jgi:hypothetical protein
MNNQNPESLLNLLEQSKRALDAAKLKLSRSNYANKNSNLVKQMRLNLREAQLAYNSAYSKCVKANLV